MPPDPRPYVATRLTVCRADGTTSLTLMLEDDQPGLVRIEEDPGMVTTGVVLVDTAEIPALIEGLREMMRVDRKARREMEDTRLSTPISGTVLAGPASTRTP